MKIRTITIGLTLTSDCVYNQLIPFEDISNIFNDYKELLKDYYEVQTTRLSLNGFEEWLVPLILDTKYYTDEEKIQLENEIAEYKLTSTSSKCLLEQPLYNIYKEKLIKYIQYFESNLKKYNITLCNFGSNIEKKFYYFIPFILANSDMILMSVNVMKNKEEDDVEISKLSVFFNDLEENKTNSPIISNSNNTISTEINYMNIASSFNDCFFVSKLIKKIHEAAGDIGNFKLCVTFNVKTNGPFFPSSSCTSNKITEKFLDKYENLFSNSTIKTSQANLKYPILRVSLGLENGSFLYKLFSSINKKYFYSIERIRNVLHREMYKHCLKMQQIISTYINDTNQKIKSNHKNFINSCFYLKYEGIDSSINPGLGSESSVGNAIEYFLSNIKNSRDSAPEFVNENSTEDYEFDEEYQAYYDNIEDEVVQEVEKIVEKKLTESTLTTSTNSTSTEISKSIGIDISDDIVLNKDKDHFFGSYDTLTCVSTITSALKTLNLPYDFTDKDKKEREPILLTGYNGLMLPVMEDYVLSLRAIENTYSMKEILLYSTLCGVGIDTVPVPEEFSLINLAGLFNEHSALASRLNKPLSCRVLPMKGLKAGDLTDIHNVFLCNSAVFPL